MFIESNHHLETAKVKGQDNNLVPWSNGCLTLPQVCSVLCISSMVWRLFQSLLYLPSLQAQFLSAVLYFNILYAHNELFELLQRLNSVADA